MFSFFFLTFIQSSCFYSYNKIKIKNPSDIYCRGNNKQNRKSKDQDEKVFLFFSLCNIYHKSRMCDPCSETLRSHNNYHQFIGKGNKNILRIQPSRTFAVVIQFRNFRQIFLWRWYEIIIIMALFCLCRCIIVWLGSHSAADSGSVVRCQKSNSFLATWVSQGNEWHCVGNDITISLISCQSETGTKLIIQILFAFTAEQGNISVFGRMCPGFSCFSLHVRSLTSETKITQKCLQISKIVFCLTILS